MAGEREGAWPGGASVAALPGMQRSGHASSAADTQQEGLACASSAVHAGRCALLATMASARAYCRRYSAPCVRAWEAGHGAWGAGMENEHVDATCNDNSCMAGVTRAPLEPAPPAPTHLHNVELEALLGQAAVHQARQERVRQGGAATIGKPIDRGDQREGGTVSGGGRRGRCVGQRCNALARVHAPRVPPLT